jgi:protein involved in polysaccharide export with SLBB domain
VCTVRLSGNTTEWIKVTISLLCLASWTAVTGCSSTKALQTSDILGMNGEIESQAYVLWPGDTITVKLLYNSELNEEVVIRPDGMISLQPIGDVKAAGRTPSELDSILTQEYCKVLHLLGEGDRISINVISDEKLSDEVVVGPDGIISLQRIGDAKVTGLTSAELSSMLINKYSQVMNLPQVTVTVTNIKLPEVTVIVRNSVAQRVYVGGEVARPGMIPITGMLRSLEAVIQAGGPLETAELKNIVLMRYNGSQEAGIWALDMRRIMKGEMPDVRLQPYDVVYLPKTSIAEVNSFVRQYVHNLIPVQFNFIYNVNREIKVESE